MDNKDKNLKLSEAILRTVVFFNLFNFPLTLADLWRLLPCPASLKEVEGAVKDLLKEEKIAGKGALVMLPGREFITGIRDRRYIYANRKYRRVRRMARALKYIPWISFIGIANRIGPHNLKDVSDIDMLIVCAAKRVFISRLFCVGLAKLFGVRPKGDRTRDTICLSFYLSDKALSLESLRLGPKFEDDPYFTYWLACLLPIYDRRGIYLRLFEANQWLRAQLPNWQPANLPSRWRIKPLKAGLYEDLCELFLGGLEPKIKRLEIRIMPAHLISLMNVDTRVVITDDIIKLHSNDRREMYKKEWKDRIKIHCPKRKTEIQ